MELKECQAAALQDFGRWRDELESARLKSEEQIAALQGADIPEDARESIRNYPKTAWDNLNRKGGVADNAGEYVSRTDDGRPSHPAHLLQNPHRRGQDAARRRRAGERLNRPNRD